MRLCHGCHNLLKPLLNPLIHNHLNLGINLLKIFFLQKRRTTPPVTLDIDMASETRSPSSLAAAGRAVDLLVVVVVSKHGAEAFG